MDMISLRRNLMVGAVPNLTEYTVTGNPVAFTTQLVKPVKSVTVPLSYTQSGTGDPYPPGGGKNKFDKDSVIRKDYYGIEYSGEIVTSSASGFTENFIPINPSTTYTLSGSGGRVIAYYDNNKEFLSREVAQDTPFSFITRSDAKYIRIQYRLSDVDMSTWQLEEGSSATTYAPYSNIRPISGVSGLFCVHAKKNMATLRGFSATNRQYEYEGVISNTYGTTISSVEPVSSLVITQTDATTDYGKSNYRNGYFSIRTDNLVNGQYYDISLKVTDITSNPLNASLSDWMIMPGQGSGSVPSEVIGNTIIVKNLLYREATLYRQAFEVRNCGMSCTVSEFMITPANTNDGVYEAYDGSRLDVTFPALGKNLFDKSAGIELLEKNILVARNDGYGVPIHMKAGVTYYVYVNAGTNPNEISLRVPYQATTIYVKYTSNTGYLDYTPEEDVDVAINAYWINGRPEEATDLMVETGSKTSYEPYNNSVYGGSLDLVSGVLTVEQVTYSLKLSEMAKTTYADRDGYQKIDIPFAYKIKNKSTQISNIAKYSWNMPNEGPVPHFFAYTPPDGNTMNLYLALPTGVDGDTVFTICAELENPFTILLDPHSTTALKGTNTFWTNTIGDLTIKYLDKA